MALVECQTCERIREPTEMRHGVCIPCCTIAELREALRTEREACAKIADAKAIEYLSPKYATGQPLSSLSERFACKQIAEAIRARQ